MYKKPQEQVKKAFCYQKLFCFYCLNKLFQCSQTFFLTVCQNNFGKKIPCLQKYKNCLQKLPTKIECCCRTYEHQNRLLEKNQHIFSFTLFFFFRIKENPIVTQLKQLNNQTTIKQLIQKFRSLKFQAEVVVEQVNNLKLLIYLVCINYQMEI